MEDGIVIGSVSEQSDTKDFNKRTNHIGEGGKVLNIPEGDQGDMAAFVLFATNIDDIRRVGLAYEKQESIGKSIIKAFTFEIEREFDGDIRNLVVEQVLQQCGFQVGLDFVEYLGKSFVGEKSGNHCHQFGIAVDKRLQVQKTSENPKVLNTSFYWSTNEEIKQMEDWICQLTCIKRYTSKMNAIIIQNKPKNDGEKK